MMDEDRLADVEAMNLLKMMILDSMVGWVSAFDAEHDSVRIDGKEFHICNEIELAELVVERLSISYSISKEEVTSLLCEMVLNGSPPPMAVMLPLSDGCMNSSSFSQIYQSHDISFQKPKRIPKE